MYIQAVVAATAVPSAARTVTGCRPRPASGMPGAAEEMSLRISPAERAAIVKAVREVFGLDAQVRLPAQPPRPHDEESTIR